MTPEKCRDLVEYHEHMEQWCLAMHKQAEGLVAACWMGAVVRHREAICYWREKADG